MSNEVNQTTHIKIRLTTKEKLVNLRGEHDISFDELVNLLIDEVNHEANSPNMANIPDYSSIIKEYCYKKFGGN
jgi:hypothetical protein